MSHFTVMVIGGDVEKQLAPFHEFECTGTDDEHVQDVDVTAELLEQIAGGESLDEALIYHDLNGRIVSSEAEIDKSEQHKYGYAVVTDGQLVKAVNRTNPNKKWDGWVVGGRWSGLLKLKEGADGELGRPGLFGACVYRRPGRADHAEKGAIDIEGMRSDAAGRAAAEWDAAADRCRTAGTEPASWESWKSVRGRFESVDEARAFYHDQPSLAASKDPEMSPFYNYDDHLVGRDQFVKAASNRAIAVYAVLKDGQWFEQGDMGWFGCSDDKLTADQWAEKVNELFDSLPDDTLITIVDCHI